MTEIKYVEYEREAVIKLDGSNQSESQTISTSSNKIKIVHLKTDERSYWEKIKSNWLFLLIIGFFKFLMNAQ